MATEAQLAANRANAKRSTGPRTTEGKMSSSANSFKHGAYGVSGMAIPRGPFAEDPEELEAFIGMLVENLDPRDDLEYEEARNIALAYLRLRRLSRYEAESIAHIGRKGRSREEHALGVLNRILETSSRIESRSTSSLDRAIARYKGYRARELPEDG